MGLGSFTALRFAYLKSLISIAFLSFAYTEVFSAFNSLNYKTSVIYWFSVSFVLLLLAFRNKSFSIFSRTQKQKFLLIKSLDRKYRVLLLVLAASVILPLFVQAIYAPPSNLDSNNYHLLRIVSWINNQNVNHFPTNHVQQLYHNVLSEYMIMQTMLLAGTDQFANLIQFNAMLGSLAAVSLIAKKLGFDYRIQVLSLILLLLLPIGIFESTTTQNDYLACFFFLCFVAFGYDIISSESKSKISQLIFLSLTLALGGFTKYPALLFAFPFGMYFGYHSLYKFGFSFGLKTVIITVFVLGLIFSPFFYRNYQLFGNVLSPQPDSRLHGESIPSEKHSPAYTLSTLSKNVGIHLGLPNTWYNKQVDNALDKFHRLLNIDPDDPANNNNPYYTRFVVHEDFMPNTLHFILLILAIVVTLLKSKDKRILALLFMAFFGLLVFSTFLKYQPFSSRTQMPLFAIGCIIIAYAWHSLLRFKALYLILPFLLTSFFFVLGNPNKMLIPFRYYFKLATGHLPRDVCPSLAEKLIYEKRLSSYYDFSIKGDCFPIKIWPSYTERLETVNRLDELDYFKKDKDFQLFSMSRSKAYYMSHVQDYDNIMRLIPFMPREGGNIGVLYAGETGYYHHLQVMESEIGKPFHLQYIHYKKEYEVLDNAHHEFRYQYILSDSEDLVRREIEPALIDKTYNSNGLLLVRLKQPSQNLYVY